MKKFLGILMFTFLLLFSSVSYASNEIEATITCDKYGHIFTDKNQTFQIDVINTSSATFNGTIEYSIISDNVIISSKEENISIAPNGSITNFPTLDCPQYGIYTLQATITDGVTDYDTVTMPFSLINASDENELNKRMFVNTHLEVYDNGEETIELLKNAGFGGFRNPVYWFEVETNNKNEYKMPDFCQDIIEACDKGLEPLIVLTGGNSPWGCINYENNDLAMAPSTTEQIQAFANYCAHVATKFKGKVKHYEIWNEFMEPGSNNGDSSGTAYAKILAAASKAIKNVDPDAIVVGMSTSFIKNSFIKEAEDALEATGDADCYDVVSVHPYDFNTSLGTSYIIQLTNYTKSLTGKPVWYTERGWDTSTGETGVTEQKQAFNIVNDYLVFLENNSCDRLFWYDLQNDGVNQEEMEHNFGLVKSVDADIPGEAKPSYIAAAAMNKLLSTATFKSGAKSGSGRVYSFTDKNGDNLYAISGSVGNNVTITTGEGKFELLDMYSNVVEVITSTGSYSFTQTDDIMYLRKHYEPAGCNVTLSDGQLLVSGYSIEPGQQVSLFVTSANEEIIYAGQTACDNERAYSFTASTKGINELYIKVNYGDVYDTEIETGFVLKLMCDGKRIHSISDITANGDIKLVVSINDEITTDTDVYGAVYSGNTLKFSNKITLKPGDTGDRDIIINLTGIDSFDKISGFVWETMNPVFDGVYFR